MLPDVLALRYSLDKEGIQIDNTICNHLPSYSESKTAIEYMVSIREQYCPVVNYDISRRASRGVFIGIPDSGIMAANLLENHNICDVSMCTFTPERRLTIARNAYLWGIDGSVSLTSSTVLEALNWWYSKNATMTPIYLDVTDSIPILSLSVIHEEKIAICGLDLKEILIKALTAGAPLLYIRCKRRDEDIIRKYELDVDHMLINDTISEQSIYISIVPHAKPLSEAAIVYPGVMQLPTIFSQKQFQKAWSLGGEVKERILQWLKNEIPLKYERAEAFINQCMESEEEKNRQDSFIYTELYHLVFPTEEMVQSMALESDDTMKPIVLEKEDAEGREANPIIPALHAIPAEIEMDREERAAKGRAQSRAKDLINMLPDSFRSQSAIRDYLDIGCADGMITIAIGDKLGLRSDHIFGCDVRDLPPNNSINNLFQFRHYEGTKLPYYDNAFDIVTCFMVLHHIPDVERFIMEIKRVLRPGGVFVIREHNCDPEENRLLLDIQHGLYALVLQKTIETPDFCTTFQTWFKSREEWTQLLEKEGLLLVNRSQYGYTSVKQWERLSTFADGCKRKPDGTILNLLKTYYSAYRNVSTQDTSRNYASHSRERSRDRDIKNDSKKNTVIHKRRPF